MATIYWTIFVRQADMQRAMRLAPDCSLTNRRVHAAMITDKARAERFVDQMNNGRDGAEGTVAWVAPF